MGITGDRWMLVLIHMTGNRKIANKCVFFVFIWWPSGGFPGLGKETSPFLKEFPSVHSSELPGEKKCWRIREIRQNKAALPHIAETIHYADHLPPAERRELIILIYNYYKWSICIDYIDHSKTFLYIFTTNLCIFVFLKNCLFIT